MSDEHNHNDKYVRKDLCSERVESMRKNLKSMNEKIKEKTKSDKKRFDKIEGRTTATLVFAISTLVGIIVLLITG